MPDGTAGEFSPEDAARLARWEAAGRPVVPLVIDSAGVVHATTLSLPTVLRATDPAWRRFRATACRWVDEHCPEG